MRKRSGQAGKVERVMFHIEGFAATAVSKVQAALVSASIVSKPVVLFRCCGCQLFFVSRDGEPSPLQPFLGELVGPPLGALVGPVRGLLGGPCGLGLSCQGGSYRPHEAHDP